MTVKPEDIQLSQQHHRFGTARGANARREAHEYR